MKEFERKAQDEIDRLHFDLSAPFFRNLRPVAQRSRGIARSLALATFLAVGIIGSSRSITVWNADAHPERSSRVTESLVAGARVEFKDRYGQLPLSFVRNDGQADSSVDFIARGSGYTLFLRPTEAVLSLMADAGKASGSGHSTETLRVKLLNANQSTRATAGRELPGHANYFIGNDPTRWRTGVPTYAAVTYRNVYDGIDLVYYGNQRQLEYDFVVHPGSDPRRVRLQFDGGLSITVDRAGDLTVRTATGSVRQKRPQIYQEIDGSRQPVDGRFVVDEKTMEVGFAVDTYDPHRTLVIDPTLDYSTYLGGSSQDIGFGIVADAQGNTYVTGRTVAADYPTSGALQPAPAGGQDAFVSKLDPTGSTLLYSTYLGGAPAAPPPTPCPPTFPPSPCPPPPSADDNDTGFGIAVDATGAAYVTGNASEGFPTTAGAFDTTFNGGGTDAFATKLDPTGSSLVYSTYLGGADSDTGFDIAVDGDGSAYVMGRTSSAGFPTTPSSADSTYNGQFDIFVTKLSATGSGPLMYSTFVGGSSDDKEGFVIPDIAVDGDGSAYVTGTTFSLDFPVTPGAFDTTHNGNPGDAFVTKLDSAGSTLLYSTYLGGSGQDNGGGIAVDSDGSAYVTGLTKSANFPSTLGAFDTTFSGGIFSDAFVTKLDPTGSALVYSTFLGGSSDDRGEGLGVDGAGNAYVIGTTASPGFPTTPDASDTTLNDVDAFITKLDPTGSGPLLYSSFLGGSQVDVGSDIAVTARGSVTVTGLTFSSDFAVTVGGFDTSANGGGDAYVAKLNLSGLLDETPPIITVPGPLQAEAASPGGAAVTFTVTAADDIDPAPTVSCSPSSDSTFPLGQTVVMCTAADADGNSSTASFTVVVIDTVPPAISNVPSDIIREASGPDGAVVTWPAPAATDLFNGAVPVTCVPQSGSMFAVGSEAVQCTAVDLAANHAIATFNVTVRDTTPPVVLNQLSADSLVLSSPAAVPVSASDSVGVASVLVNGVVATRVTGTVQNGIWVANVPVSVPSAALIFTATGLDGVGNAAPSHTVTFDNDGIASAIDRNRVTLADESAVFSSGFVHGPTTGAIGRPGGIAIEALPDDDTSRVSLAGYGTASSSVAAMVPLCTGSSKWIELNVSERAVVSCSSVGNHTLNVSSRTGIIDVWGYMGYSCCPHHHHWLHVLLSEGMQYSFGSPGMAAADNPGPLHVELVRVRGDETEPEIGSVDLASAEVFGSFDLDPGESIDTVIAPGSNGEDAQLQVTVLSGTVTVTISGQTHTLSQGEDMSFAILYAFTGFYSPVDNPPVVNELKAGSAVAVKFSLNGNLGSEILAAGYPQSQQVACDSGASLDAVEQTLNAGSSTLTYDAATNQYIYVWKTDKAWANSCRQLNVKLQDGTSHLAIFQFKK